MALAELTEGINFDPNQITGTLLIGGIIILVIVVGFFLFMIVRGIMQYKVPVNIWSRTGSSAVYAQDKAKIVYRRDTKRPHMVQLQKTKFKEMYPGSDYFHVNSSGRQMLNAFIVDNKLVFFKIEDWLPNQELFSLGWKQSDLNSLLDAIEHDNQRFSAKDFWSQHAGTVVSGVLALMILIMGIILFQGMQGVIDAVGTINVVSVDPTVIRS